MKIKVEPLLPTGNYLNCRIGLEIETHDNVNIEQEVNQLWDCITAIHMKRYPHLYTPEGRPKYEQYQGDENHPNSIPAKVVEEPVDKIKVMITVINLCASMEALLRFAKQVDRENNQELTEAYNNKLQSLKNGQDSFKDISNRF